MHFVVCVCRRKDSPLPPAQAKPENECPRQLTAETEESTATQAKAIRAHASDASDAFRAPTRCPSIFNHCQAPRDQEVSPPLVAHVWLYSVTGTESAREAAGRVAVTVAAGAVRLSAPECRFCRCPWRHLPVCKDEGHQAKHRGRTTVVSTVLGSCETTSTTCE